MRVLSWLGLVVVAAGAAIVPLPWVVAVPGDVVDVGEAVTIRIDPQLQEAGGAKRGPLTGRYVSTRDVVGPSFVQLAVAAVAPGRSIRRARQQPPVVLAQVPVVAALRGLGLSPARMEGAALPVTVDLDDSLEPSSLAAALHVFDTTSSLDVAQDRVVGAVGAVALDESLRCTGAVGAAVAGLRAAGADVVVVPRDCEDRLDSHGIVRAATFVQAVEALLAP